uniref:Uncharacterized protein n=1 Tax=Panagrolaimus sp. ES5 TaxID=591445 RepID=A0AC34FZ35_9BILA
MAEKSRNFIVEVRDMLFNLNTCIRIHNINTRKMLKKDLNYSLIIKEQDKFFSSLPSMVLLKRVKALVFYLFEFDDILPSKSLAFRLRCVKFCKENGIFCFFTDEILLCPLAAVLHTKTIVSEGEGIMVIRPMGHGTNAFMATKLIREKDRYYILDCVPHVTVEEFRDCFMGEFEPKKVFIYAEPSLRDSPDNILFQLKNFFKKYDPVLLGQDKDKLYTDAMITKVLHLLSEKISPYDVATPYDDIFDIRLDNRKTLFKAERFTILPYQKSVAVEVGAAKSVSLFQETTEVAPECIKEIQLASFTSKKVKITLKIDYNAIPEFSVEKESINNDKELPTDPEKAQFIFGKQHFSVSVYDENGKEYILEDSDGLDKTPIYISFVEKKPVIGKVAMEAYGSNPKFVVFDLIKLCSVDSADIMNPKWEFRFFKDEDGKYLKVKLETFEGEKDADTAFLLALIIRNGLKRILTKVGKMMEEIEIGFDGFVANKILKDNFIKAAGLMKVKIVFV